MIKKLLCLIGSIARKVLTQEARGERGAGGERRGGTGRRGAGGGGRGKSPALSVCL